MVVQTTPTVKNKSAGRVSDENLQANTLDEVNELRDQLRKDAYFYKQRLVGFLMDDQVNPKEIYKPLPFDDIKAALQEWLNPEEEKEEEFPSDGLLTVEEKPQTNYSLSTKPAAKKSKAEAFDDLFEEDDDMPF